MIYYGTFNEVCEEYFNEDGDFRELVKARIMKDD
jgi:hypothetical protein